MINTMRIRCHKNLCAFIRHTIGSGTKHKKVYIFRRKKNHGGWWCEPPRHVRLTPEGIIKAMRGSCSHGHAQVFEVDLDKLTVKKIFEGENK